MTLERRRNDERGTRRRAPAGPDAGLAEARRAGDEVFAAADEQIDGALAHDTDEFLGQTRQQGAE